MRSCPEQNCRGVGSAEFEGTIYCEKHAGEKRFAKWWLDHKTYIRKEKRR